MLMRLFGEMRSKILSIRFAAMHGEMGKGTASGTHLEEVMSGLRLSFPPVKRFGDQMHDPLKNQTDAKMSPDRRRELLSKTPEGEAVLRREKALATTPK